MTLKFVKKVKYINTRKAYGKMKLLFKQRIFSWFDSYDIYFEDGSLAYTVKGELSWGHCLKIFDSYGNYVGTVKEKIFTFLPKFEIYINGSYAGCISKEFTFFKPKFNIDFNGWHVEGDFFEWDYTVIRADGSHAAYVSKEIFHFSDTYSITVNDPEDAAAVLMLVLAIDAEKCSRS